MAKVYSQHGKYAGVIVGKMDMRSLNQHINQSLDKIKAHLINQLSYIGEECVRIARESGSYNDITGNLRSSIGYVILEDGEPVVQGQDKKYSGSEGDGSEGPAAAQSLLSKMQSEYPDGIVLIVCAGMHYAAYVENVHHKDVLTSAELTAESLMKQLLNGLIN